MTTEVMKFSLDDVYTLRVNYDRFKIFKGLKEAGFDGISLFHDDKVVVVKYKTPTGVEKFEKLWDIILNTIDANKWDGYYGDVNLANMKCNLLRLANYNPNTYESIEMSVKNWELIRNILNSGAIKDLESDENMVLDDFCRKVRDLLL